MKVRKPRVFPLGNCVDTLTVFAGGLKVKAHSLSLENFGNTLFPEVR